MKHNNQGNTAKWVLMASLIATITTSLTSPSAVAARVETTGSSLPTPIDSMASVWTGTYAFFFGGGQTRLDTYSDDILRFDPATGEVSTMTSSLPTALRGAAAVWTGTYAFIFGGRSSGGYLDAVVRYDPANNAVTTMAADLPTGLYEAAAVWYDGYAYIFGGETAVAGPATDQILRYNPGSDEISVLSSTLPSPRSSMAAVVLEGASAPLPPIILVGGASDDLDQLSDILGYFPDTDTVETRGAKIPPRSSVSAAAIGGHVFVFGGYFGRALGEIFEYNVADDILLMKENRLPTPRSSMATFFDGESVYLVGGFETPANTSNSSDDIVRFDMSPRSPILTPPICELVACVDRADLFWTSSPIDVAEGQAFDGLSNPERFRIYRAEGVGPLVLIHETAGHELFYSDSPPATGVYRYQVSGVNQYGEGTLSNSVVATIIIADPKVSDNPDGSCSVYNDVDKDGVVDPGEHVGTVPCPGPEVKTNPDGSLTVFDDKNDNGQVDAGEVVVQTPPSPDQDGDGIPDSQEPFLCANENPNFNFEGTCDGDNYSPATVEGLIEDLEQVLP